MLFTNNKAMGFPVSDTIAFENCLFEAHFLPTSQYRSNSFGKEYVNQGSFVWKLVKIQWTEEMMFD